MRIITNFLGIFIAVFQIGGGFRKTVSRIIMLYRLDGLTGIKRGIRLILNAGNSLPINKFGDFDRNDYKEWVRRYDSINDEKRVKIKKIFEKLYFKPKISIIVLIQNPNLEWLQEAVESVKKQIYTNWELCISYNDLLEDKISILLGDCIKLDTRIKLDKNGGSGKIDVKSNNVFKRVTGEWVIVLNQGDKLAEHALFWISKTINEIPYARLIYSDEDMISPQGERLYPHFKCEWNQDLFYSYNMLSQLTAYHASVIKETGGYSEEHAGAQDYDLALRVIELLKPREIVHVPRILYHRREHANLPSIMANTRLETALAGERAINHHFYRMGIKGFVKYDGYGYAPTYEVPNPGPLVSIVIPTRNRRELIKQCIESILQKTTYSNYEIIVIDNGSDEPGAIKFLNDIRINPKVRIIRDDSPFNFSYLNNMAVKKATGDIICLINNDIEVITPEWLSIMVAHSLRPGVGAVGAKLWYRNHTLQHGGVILGITGVASHSHKYFPYGSFGYSGRLCLTQNLSAVTAACLVIKKSIFEEVGGLNEKELKVAFNDVDFCLRVRDAGYRNVWTPLAELFHHESLSRGVDDTPEKSLAFIKEYAYMKKRWGYQLQNDPAYNPNLTLDYCDFSYAWPPRVESI